MSDGEPQPANVSTADADAAAGLVRGREIGHDELTRGLIEAVSHHIRSPVTVILGHVEFWIGQHHEVPAELYESLSTVMRAGRRLADVGAGVCDLIDVGFADPGPADTVQLGQLVADEVATFRDLAAHRNIELVVECDRAVWCVVNSARLQRALRELLDNALRFAPDRSTVRVAATAAVSGIQITVSDEGGGVEPADRERLVRPFERGNPGRQPAAGLGMGLAVASAVAASHGGHLLLSNGLEGGLHACLELPVDLTYETDVTPRSGDYSCSRASL
jgi:signal transduction histidine kinase